MEKTTVNKTSIPSDTYFKSREHLRKVVINNGDPIVNKHVDVEKEKPKGSSNIIRTIKVENMDKSRKNLREFLITQIINEKFELNDKVRLSVKGAALYPEQVGLQGSVLNIDVDDKLVNVKWENGEEQSLAYDYVEPYKDIYWK